MQEDLENRWYLSFAGNRNNGCIGHAQIQPGNILHGVEGTYLTGFLWRSGWKQGVSRNPGLLDHIEERNAAGAVQKAVDTILIGFSGIHMRQAEQTGIHGEKVYSAEWLWFHFAVQGGCLKRRGTDEYTVSMENFIWHEKKIKELKTNIDKQYRRKTAYTADQRPESREKTAEAGCQKPESREKTIKTGKQRSESRKKTIKG